MKVIMISSNESDENSYNKYIADFPLLLKRTNDDSENDVETRVPRYLINDSGSPQANEIGVEDISLKNAQNIFKNILKSDKVNPLNVILKQSLMTLHHFPSCIFQNKNHRVVRNTLPKLRTVRYLDLGDGFKFNISNVVGSGSYGVVYKAIDMETGAEMALKYIRSSDIWETYIYTKIQQRMKKNFASYGIMGKNFKTIFCFNSSVIATEYTKFGTMSDIYYHYALSEIFMHEILVMHFASEICKIVNYLHSIKIIHGDIKPDNFLLMNLPTSKMRYPSWRLIDYGKSIDMKPFGERKFNTNISADHFTCPEMLEERPWSYETDLYCVGSTAFTMLFGDIMDIQKVCNTWKIKKRFPSYYKGHIWGRFFNNLLNINASNLKNILKNASLLFDEEVSQNKTKLKVQMRKFSCIVQNFEKNKFFISNV